MAASYQRYNIGDIVYIAGMVSKYRIKEVDYDFKRAKFKYSLEGHPSWVFEHVITRTGGDKVVKSFKKDKKYICNEWTGNAFTVGKVYTSPKDGCLESNNESQISLGVGNYKKFTESKKATVRDTKSPGEYQIGEEVSVRGIRDETFVIKEWQIENGVDPYGKTMYKLSDGNWYAEDVLYIDAWNETIPIPAGVREKYNPGDVIQCVIPDKDRGKGSGYKYRRYYMVKSCSDYHMMTVIDENGSENNGWNAKNFKKIRTGTANAFDDSKYMCVEDIKGQFTKGKIYQHTGKDGYLMDNQGTIPSISKTHHKHFRVILPDQGVIPEDDWDATPGDTGPRPDSNKPVDDWEVDEVIPPNREVVEIEKLLDVDIKTEMKHMFPMPILLEGPVGVGKSTLVMELAKELDLEYFASILTEGTSKNEFTGYKNVMDGSYIGGEFRRCYEFGGLYNLEELNATTANLPIIFNTIENGYFVFADKTVKGHKDFRLVATMNTITNAKDFGGRRELDLSVRSRFHRILMKKADDSRFLPSTLIYAEAVNQLLEAAGISLLVDPRDMARFEHMCKNKDISTEVCLYKCMFNEKMDVHEDKLREIIKSGGEWK